MLSSQVSITILMLVCAHYLYPTPTNFNTQTLSQWSKLKRNKIQSNQRHIMSLFIIESMNALLLFDRKEKVLDQGCPVQMQPGSEKSTAQFQKHPSVSSLVFSQTLSSACTFFPFPISFLRCYFNSVPLEKCPGHVKSSNPLHFLSYVFFPAKEARVPKVLIHNKQRRCWSPGKRKYWHSVRTTLDHKLFLVSQLIFTSNSAVALYYAMLLPQIIGIFQHGVGVLSSWGAQRPWKKLVSWFTNTEGFGFKEKRTSWKEADDLC